MNRSVELLKYDFRFQKFQPGSVTNEMFQNDFDDRSWTQVRVPHDWAISEPFDAENDVKEKNVIEDGVHRLVRQTGRTGGLPIVGQGVYRKWIDIPESDRGRRIFLECDGIMWNSVIYCNGIEVGKCHFGYKSFEVELTDTIRFGERNLIAVFAEVETYCCRWYPGGGIYRNLRLVKKDPSHIRYHGIWVRTLETKPIARFEITADLENASGFTAEILAPDGTCVCTASTEEDTLFVAIENPEYWDLDHPALYTAVITLESGDSEAIRFGIRSSEFTRDGYFLNGRYQKLNGVCMHHDLGSLGAAVNISALRRQLEILRGMGVNAIRTSHNPPTTELLDLCDEMGFVVMDEFFDEWDHAKVEHGYSRYFMQHAHKDVIDIIRRDRNHPCVILWSIGNEIEEQNIPDGWKEAKMLSETVHATDPTRPVTAGLSRPDESFANHLAYYLDVVGLNYKPLRYKEFHQKHPEVIFIGSETESCVSTRSVYHLPAEVEIPAICRDSLTVSAYDLAAPSWAYYSERELSAQQDCPFISGEFIWTGFDYLGEPTPYFTEWPSRSSYFGVVDLAGLPKNRYYLYRSVWTDIPTLHIFPHWTWPGMEGKNVPIHIFTNYFEVELFINGEAQGKRRHTAIDEIRRFRMIWENTIYQPGEVLAVAYDINGKEMERKVLRTAEAPAGIRLEAYKENWVADGDDVNYITASIVDANGTLCETSDQRLTFRVTGPCELLTTDAGDQRETESFARPDKKTLGGKLVACIRSVKDQPGTVTITCTGEGLAPATLVLSSGK